MPRTAMQRICDVDTGSFRSPPSKGSAGMEMRVDIDLDILCEQVEHTDGHTNGHASNGHASNGHKDPQIGNVFERNLVARIDQQQAAVLRYIEAHHQRIKTMIQENFDDCPSEKSHSHGTRSPRSAASRSPINNVKARNLRSQYSVVSEKSDSECSSEVSISFVHPTMSQVIGTAFPEPENGSDGAWTCCCCRWFDCCLRCLEQFMDRLCFGMRSGGGPDMLTPKFDIIVGVSIVLNALVMCVQYQWLGYKSEMELSRRSADGWQHAESVFLVLEHLFVCFFVIELFLRVHLHGCFYFKSFGNAFDVFLVVSSVLDLLLVWANKDGATNLTIMRFCRLLKFVRVMRIVRTMKLFTSLRILVRTIYSSARSLIWSMALLGMIMTMGGMCLCQLARDFIADADADVTVRKKIFHYYGTPPRAMYAMFEATLSGCWPNYARPLIDEAGTWFVVFWLFYATVVIFAIIRIITALFLKETLQVAGADAEQVIQDELMKKNSYMNKLEKAFEQMDLMNHGALCWEKFHEVLENPRVKASLAILDLEVHESELLFNLLDDGDGAITLTEFLHGVQRLKGQARTLDLMTLQHDCKHLMRAVSHLQSHFESIFGEAPSDNGKRHSLKRRNTFPDYCYKNDPATEETKGRADKTMIEAGLFGKTLSLPRKSNGLPTAAAS